MTKVENVKMKTGDLVVCKNFVWEVTGIYLGVVGDETTCTIRPITSSAAPMGAVPVAEYIVPERLLLDHKLYHEATP